MRGNELIRSLREYLEQHYNESINRKDVEELVHMNQDYLNRSFKCATGYTLMEYVQHFRILKAKEYLADMQKSISEIGGLVGYESPPYFSKIFKKCTGDHPGGIPQQPERERALHVSKGRSRDRYTAGRFCSCDRIGRPLYYNQTKAFVSNLWCN